MSGPRLGVSMIVAGLVLAVVGVVLLLVDGSDSEPADASPSDESAATTSTTEAPDTPATTTTTEAPDTPATTTTTEAPTASEAPDTTSVAAETPEEFVAVLNAGFAGDAELLLERLHEATISRYGLDACRTYLAQVTASGQPPLTFLELVGVGPWDYPIDDLTTSLDEVTTASVNREVDGQTETSEVHWKLVDGRYRWFTDCGEPLPS